MNTSNAFTAKKRKDRPALLALSVLLSIVLHLLVVFTLPYEKLSSDNLQIQPQKPTIVELVDSPKQVKQQKYELDQHPSQPTPEPPKASSRLAEQNQKVKKEMAPKGEDTRDQTSKPAMQKQARPAQLQTRTKPQKQQPVKAPAKQTKSTPTQKLISEQGRLPAQTEEALPSLQQLTQLSPSTLTRIIRSEQSTRERIKERNDLETGDTVWLNLERGLLISFFRRFRNQIEGVWNYPREAIEKEQQGTLLLKITVDRDGKLRDVDLLKSSGSEILDFEAIQAIYRAAPFGPLGKHYPHPDLKIMAHFSYRISGKYIYGQKR